MHRPCAKFGDFIFSRFGFAGRHTDRITEADGYCTDATTDVNAVCNEKLCIITRRFCLFVSYCNCTRVT